MGIGVARVCAQDSQNLAFTALRLHDVSSTQDSAGSFRCQQLCLLLVLWQAVGQAPWMQLYWFGLFCASKAIAGSVPQGGSQLSWRLVVECVWCLAMTCALVHHPCHMLAGA